MQDNRISFLHLIPFDLGYPFFDILNIDNSKNLLMAEEFLSALETHFLDNNTIKFKNTLKINKYRKNILEYACTDDSIDKSICRIQFTPNLYAFVLLNGIGCFAFLDDGSQLENSNNTPRENLVFKANYIKRKAQKALLTGYYNNETNEIFHLERFLMKDFMNISWRFLKEIAKKHKIKCFREYSCNSNYKNGGFSYILSAYLIQKGVFTENDLTYLLYSSFTDETNISKEKATELIHNFTTDNIYSYKNNQGSYMFSWTAISAEIENIPQNFDEYFTHEGLCRILKQEIYVQSRWFLADNSLDNTLKSFNNKLEGLQRLEGILDHYEAELNNEISANMTTEEKNMLSYIITTSEINSLYKSVKRQINIQVKLKDEQEKKRKKRNLLFLSLFMAIFTACSLYSEINAIIVGDKQNIWLLVTMVFIAIFTVLIDYFYK